MQAVMNIMVSVKGAKAAQAALAGVGASTNATGQALTGAAARAAAFNQGMSNLTRGMERYGKNMQWVGRQIEYNFTLPIAVASGFAIKWAMDNERAMIRLKKVYGDNSMPTKQFTEETEALGRAFRFLSDNFGVALSEVIDAGATFAQAGAGNIAVANGVRAALELQILGNMELAEATSALIAIQAQYNVSSKELTQIIADLNAVENTTTVTLQDQITAMQKSAGVAREAGVSHRELAGFIAAMVPAAGNANEAGNSLKTTITRIMAPTRQAREAMEGLGIATEGTAWRNANATERFVTLAEALENVSTEQRTVALTHIAGRRQVSRLAIMLRDLNNEQGRYATALRVTADPADSMLRKQKEIDIFLRSGPQGFQIMTTQIKNYAAEIGAQLMPSLIAVMRLIRDWARSFAELDPQVRNTALAMIFLVAAVGPVVRILGSSILLITQFVKFFGMLARGVIWAALQFGKFGGAIAWVFKELPVWIALYWGQFKTFVAAKIALFKTALIPAFKAWAIAAWAAAKSAIAAGFAALGPWGVVALAVVALGAVMWKFRDQVAEIWGSVTQWVVTRWERMVIGIANVMRRVVEVVRTAAQAVVNLFAQMMTPFSSAHRTAYARKNVSNQSKPVPARAKGGAVVKGETYLVGEEGPELWTANKSGTIIPANVTAALEALSGGKSAMSSFDSAVSAARSQMRKVELAQMRSDITSWVPDAGPAFDRLAGQIVRLEGVLSKVGTEYERQERVVDAWRDALDDANLNVERHQSKLDSLRETASRLSDELSDAKALLDEYANMPIEGMRAYADQLFENEQAQKRLRLEILKLEEAHGSVDDLKRKLAELQGDIERMSGRREDLRLAGAGSDILGAYDQQIDQMRQAQNEIMEGTSSGPASQIEKLTEELDNLRREAEMIELERDLKFDPLTRQIERMVDAYQEMPFRDIVAAIKSQKQEVDDLQEAYDKASKAVEHQEEVLKNAQGVRDEVQRSYDAEYKALQEIKDAYDALDRTISNMSDTMQGFARDAADAAQAAADAAKAAADAAKAAGGADTDAGIDAIDDWGDYDIPGGQAGLAWEEGSIDDLISEWQDEFGGMVADFDLFEPLREQWNRIKGWFLNIWDEVVAKWRVATDWFKNLWTEITESWATTIEWVKNLWEEIKLSWEGTVQWFSDTFGPIWENVVTFWTETWTRIKEEFGLFWEGIATTLSEKWEGIKAFFTGIGTWLVEQWISNWTSDIGIELQLTLAQWGEWISTAWNGIATFLSGVWESLTGWASETWNNISTYLSLKFEEMSTKVSNVWNGISTFLSNIWGEITGSVQRAAESLGGWLGVRWDRMKQNVETIWNSISRFLSGLWGNIETSARTTWGQITGFFSRTMENIRTIIERGWNAIRTITDIVWGLIEGGIIAVLRVLRLDISGAIEAINTSTSEAWGKVSATAQRIWDTMSANLNRVMEGIKGIFRRGVSAVGEIWDGIKSKIRSPIASAVNRAINPMIRGVNRVAARVGLGQFSELSIPQFHTGGVVGKDGKARNLSRQPLVSDEQLAVLRNGERVLTKAERKYYEGDPQAMLPEVGADIFGMFRRVTSTVGNSIKSLISKTVRPMINGAINSLSGITGGNTPFGGTIRGVGRYAGNGVLDWLLGVDKAVPDTPELSGGVGWRKMWEAVKGQFPWARLTSAYRPGAITATGNPSYHGKGRAIDIAGRGFMNHPDMLAITKWIAQNYRSATRELIYSGRGAQQLHNGRLHYYTGVTRRNHFDHVHWAMDNGGFLNKGWNQPIFNGTGKPEIVSPERLMRRIVREEVRGSGAAGTTNHFHGDLVFPNVEDGNDAESFIRNLESMVG